MVSSVMRKVDRQLELVEQDHWSRSASLQLDGEEVKIERASDVEKQGWRHLELTRSFREICIRAGRISFSGPDMFHNKALAVYRLMWYFGPPENVHMSLDLTCMFILTYKGYAFSIFDKTDGPMDIDSIHYVSDEEYGRHLMEEEKGKQPTELEKKLMPPKEIQEEIVSLVEFLIGNPVVIVKEGKTVSI